MRKQPINSAVARHNHHFVLYAKGHYEESEPLTDLKTIMSHRCATPVHQVRIADIVHVLLGEVQSVISNKKNGMRDFITRIREDFLVWPTVLKTSPPPTLDDVLITACLGELSVASVTVKGQTVYDIGEADPAVLPLKRKQPKSTAPTQTATPSRA